MTADYFAPVRLSDEEFRILVEKVERAFAENRAALVINATYGSREIEILDHGAVTLTDKEFEALLWIDQLLYYGMQSSSEEAIRQWASYFDESLVNVAVARARQLRTLAPSVASTWDAKSASVVPIIASVRYEVLGGDDARVIVSLPSVAIGYAGDPDLLTRNDTTMQLLENDVVYLKTHLDHILSEMRSRADDA